MNQESWDDLQEIGAIIGCCGLGISLIIFLITSFINKKDLIFLNLISLLGIILFLLITYLLSEAENIK